MQKCADENKTLQAFANKTYYIYNVPQKINFLV